MFPFISQFHFFVLIFRRTSQRNVPFGTEDTRYKYNTDKTTSQTKEYTQNISQTSITSPSSAIPWAQQTDGTEQYNFYDCSE